LSSILYPSGVWYVVGTVTTKSFPVEFVYIIVYIFPALLAPVIVHTELVLDVIAITLK